MTAAWLIAAVAVGFTLLGASLMFSIFQVLENRWLKGRIQQIGSQLKYVPKRKTDRVADSVND